jgi:hypothetical protein
MIGRRHAGAIAVNNDLFIFGGNQDSLSASALNSLEFADISNIIVSNRDITNELQGAFQLFQNYPNPFNPSTKLNYQLPKPSFVTLKIYDVLGNEVTALVNEKKPAGRYEINFNASNLSSGIYFYELQAGSFLETKKMILLH